ncbi:GntR family transcriptional regulator [Phycisphaerales bacterium AB-hyl4]|uniref:GntR family transcriptional regulator n=1 Tax=Natronomicrosphaera hydrolytica TaxID=3242702 RepID=A0ABV4U1F6_9BACT
MKVASHRVAQVIRRQILHGEYGIGQQLPTEQMLCEKFGVSRVTVREGLRILQDQGLIQRRRGSGSRVAAQPQRHIPLVHGGYFDSVWPYLDELERRVKTMRWVDAPPAIATAMSIKAGQSVLWAERVDLLSGDPVAVDEVWLEGSVATRITRDDLVHVDFLNHWQDVQQVELEYVRQSVEAVQTSTATAQSLQMRRGRPALRETCTAYLTNQRAGGLFVTHYRPDVFRLESIVRHRRQNEPDKTAAAKRNNQSEAREKRP